MKKERPILFSTPMVSVTQSGRKTQTRRICKHQHWSYSELIDVNNNKKLQKVDKNVSCPYGQIGDILWVRETWFSTRFDCMELLERGDTSHIRYKADGNYDPKKDCVGRSWKPSIHMPKKAARIWLEITDVRVERLQDISDSDAKSEGIHGRKLNPCEINDLKDYGMQWMDYTAGGVSHITPIESFKTLWESINGSGSWNENPYVWVIEFKRIERP